MIGNLSRLRLHLAPIKVPIIDWLPEYTKALFIQDLNAGLTIFFLIVPQSMAYALLAGFSTVYGLYSATIPLFIYALLGTSRQLSMGPMAITSLLLGVSCSRFGYDDGTDEYMRIAMNMSMMVGIILFLVGIFKLGTLINLISNSVLVGFISGSAVVIGINQIKYLLGINVPRFSYIHQTVYYLLTHLNETNTASAVLGILTTVLLFVMRDIKKRYKVCPTGWYPTAHSYLMQLCNFSNFLVLLIGMGVAQAVIANGGSLSIVGVIPSGLKAPFFELAPFTSLIEIFPDALALSFVSFAGNWAITTKFAIDNHYEVEATQELIAEGLTNIIGVVCNSFVVSGGLGRSAVNADSGAKTQIASCITAFCVMLCLLFFTRMLYYIPMASLGAVLEVAVYPLFNYEEMVNSYRVDRKDCFVMILTCLCTMFIGVANGLYIGIFASTLIVVWSTAFPYIAHLGRLESSGMNSPIDSHSKIYSFKSFSDVQQEEVAWGPGEHRYYRDVIRYPEALQVPGIAIVRMDASPYYANCAYFKETILLAAKGHYHSHPDVPIRKVIVDASAWVSVDLAGVRVLFEIQKELTAFKPSVVLAIAGAKAIIRDHLKRSNFIIKLGRENLNMSIDDAVLSPLSSNKEDSPMLSATQTESKKVKGVSTSKVLTSMLSSAIKTATSTKSSYVQVDSDNDDTPGDSFESFGSSNSSSGHGSNGNRSPTTTNAMHVSNRNNESQLRSRGGVGGVSDEDVTRGTVNNPLFDV